MEGTAEHVKRSLQSDDVNYEIETKKRRLHSPCKVIQPEEECSELEFNCKESDTTENKCNTFLQEPSKSEIVENEMQESNANLDYLSDDILLILLSYLNSSDLFNLSLCNQRFFNICRDKTLWYRVNATCDGRWPSHALLPSYFNQATTYLRFSKKKNSTRDLEDSCFDDKFFRTLRTLSNLKTLIVENHVLNMKTLKLKYLPESITELRLTGTQLLHMPAEGYGLEFFSKVNDILPNLEIVDVSYCQWFHPHVLLSLAKCSKLKTLVLIGCRHMKDFIPYASLAAAFGYHSLETLDMRLTDVVDREVGCFNKIKSLKHIFLEKPSDLNDSENSESISDICTTSLGMRNWHSEIPDNIVFICRIPEDGGTFVDHTLETLVVRNYPKITDITLKHAEKCLKSLKYLDITGCSCSAAQIAVFKKNRPEVKLVYSDTAV